MNEHPDRSTPDDHAQPSATPEIRLTCREQQVATRIATGAARALKKLGLKNNVELARHALRQGWVTL